jgi:hypothetical protein
MALNLSAGRIIACLFAGKNAMNNPQDPFEFVKSLWSSMGVPGFGQAAAPSAMPSFSPEEIEKRLMELKQVRQWLEMNLNMLNLQVNALEMQKTAIEGLRGGMAAATEAAKSMRGAAESFSGSAASAKERHSYSGAMPPSANAPGLDLKAMPWLDPQMWINAAQAQVSAMAPVAAPKRAAKAPAKAAKKPASRSSSGSSRRRKAL